MRSRRIGRPWSTARIDRIVPELSMQVVSRTRRTPAQIHSVAESRQRPPTGVREGALVAQVSSRAFGHKSVSALNPVTWPPPRVCNGDDLNLAIVHAIDDEERKPAQQKA